MAKSSSTKRRPAPEKPVKARKCTFCSKKGKNLTIDYKDTALLRTYISERGKIRARRVTGNCVQHQRDIAIAVKNSREVALLPFSAASR
jgi:small subunit ribosomal protein S18